MNKMELIAAIATQAGISKSDAEKIFKITFDTITDGLKTHSKIAIPGFGNFTTKVRAERQGRNPSTGQAITIPQSVVASFKPALQLKESINTTTDVK